MNRRDAKSGDFRKGEMTRLRIAGYTIFFLAIFLILISAADSVFSLTEDTGPAAAAFALIPASGLTWLLYNKVEKGAVQGQRVLRGIVVVLLLIVCSSAAILPFSLLYVFSYYGLGAVIENLVLIGALCLIPVAVLCLMAFFNGTSTRDELRSALREFGFLDDLL
jgi:hypothetical protein